MQVIIASLTQVYTRHKKRSMASNKEAIQVLSSAVSSQRDPPLEPILQPPRRAGRRHRTVIHHSQQYTFYRNPGATTVLLWNILNGCTYGIMVFGPMAFAFNKKYSDVPLSMIISITLGVYGLLGLVQVLYPIGGLLADVHFGRYKVILCSLLSIWLGYVFLSLVGVTFGLGAESTTSIYVAALLAFLVFVVGFSGYQANSVQFGLDQLLDASSEELSLFLHWFVWTENVGELVLLLLVSAAPCGRRVRRAEGFLSVLILAVSTICLAIGWCKQRWFNCEKVVNGTPYRNVYQVLKYAAKHDKPLGHRSALTYSDDYRPPRIDFAKQKYGGPFVTEVVEDVKTFLRILLMLLAIAQVFFFEVSNSYFFPIFGRHLGMNQSIHSHCSYQWLLFESGSSAKIVSVVLIPLYVILIHPHIKRWVPRIIYRMAMGVVLTTISVVSMFAIQVVANYNSLHIISNNISSNCIFLNYYHDNGIIVTLQFPTQVLFLLNLLNGIASPLINITVLEFISAQSPHTMKGLLLGVFYAFRGLFITLGCVVTFPFAQEKLWGDRHGIFDCGFYYYLSNSVLGVIGLVVFLMAARWYRNRERDDLPYSHQYAEDYYSRYASQPTTRLVKEEVESYGSFENHD